MNRNLCETKYQINHKTKFHSALGQLSWMGSVFADILLLPRNTRLFRRWSLGAFQSTDLTPETGPIKTTTVLSYIILELLTDDVPYPASC
nr:protein sprouty homolog 4 isoform X3 [Caretta caretta]